VSAIVAANRTRFQVESVSAPCVSRRFISDEQTPRAAFSLDPKFTRAVQRIALALHALAAETSPGVARGTVALRIGATRLVGRIVIVIDKTDIDAPVRSRAHVETLSVIRN
jgi:hypothetical protein